MSAADAIEASLVEVDRARLRIARLKSKQITVSDDRDYLKSVAYSWFRTHRPVVTRAISEQAVQRIDESLKAVLDATARSSARTTYLARLKTAKESLAAVRGLTLLPAPPRATLSEVPPDFTPLASDVRMKQILERRWAECHTCVRAAAPLAATVMMGGLLEALFVARANLMANKAPLFHAHATPVDSRTKKALPLPEWTLRPYIDVGAELGWISRPGKDIATVLRDYRNYVHPEKERAHGVTLNQQDAEMFWQLTKSLTQQLLASAASAGTTP